MIECDMSFSCKEPVTMIDDSGYIYCTDHGLQRRQHRRCRKLRQHELNALKRGATIKAY